MKPEHRYASWKKLFLFTFVLIVGGGLPVRGSTLEITPFYTRDLSPLVQVYGIPPAEEGDLATDGTLKSRLTLDIANIFTGDANTRELLRLDGEIYRLTLGLRYGVSRRLEIGLDLPYVWHEGGSMDGVINSFHRTFDLPEGGRDEWYNNYLRYLSVCDGETELLMEEETSGLGDILLMAGYQLYRKDSPELRAVSLRLGVEVPTGKCDRLTGSESTDVSLRLTGTDAASLARLKLTWYWALGGLWISEKKVFPERQRDLAAFGTLGLGWHPSNWWALKIQVDAHTPLYRDSELTQLDATSVQGAFGLAFRLPWDYRLDFAVTEDLAVNTAPDAIFHFSLSRRFF